MTVRDLRHLGAATFITAIVLVCAHSGLKAAVAATMFTEQANVGYLR